MKVLKFGGTSVANAECIEQTKNIVVSVTDKADKIVVVVSALGGITDALIQTADAAAAGDEQYKDQLDDIYYRHRKLVENLFSSLESKDILPFLKSKVRNLENLLNGVFLIKELSPRTMDCIMSFGRIGIVLHYYSIHQKIQSQYKASRQPAHYPNGWRLWWSQCII